MSTAESSTVIWRKSSYSSQEGGECVELAAIWRKSSHSGMEGGNCVEVTGFDSVIGVRDSKNPDGPVLEFSRSGFAALVAALKAA